MKYLWILLITFSIQGKELFSPLPQTITWSAPSDLVEQTQTCLDVWNKAVDGYFTFQYSEDNPTIKVIWEPKSFTCFCEDVYGKRVVHIINQVSGDFFKVTRDGLLLHELGHAFGLAHTDINNHYGYYLYEDRPVMFHIANTVLTLHTDDVYRIRRYYGLSTDVSIIIKLKKGQKAWVIKPHKNPNFIRIFSLKTRHMIYTLRGTYKINN